MRFRLVLIFALLSAASGCGPGLALRAPGANDSTPDPTPSPSVAVDQALSVTGPSGYANVTGTNIDLGSNSIFTIEFYVRPSAISTNDIIYSDNVGFQIGIDSGSSDFQLYWPSTCGAMNSGSSQLNGLSAAAAHQNSHVALVYDNNTGWQTFYVDGQAPGSGVALAMASACALTSFTLGAALGGGSGTFNGVIDEVRVSNYARYTGNFSPPTGPLTADGNTVLLIKFKGGVLGTTNAVDFAASGSPLYQLFGSADFASSPF